MREERYPFLSFVQKLLEFPRRLLITIIVSNEIANILLSTLLTGLFIILLGDEGKWVSIAVAAPLLMLLGEAIPKTLAKTSPMQFASITAPVLSLFGIIGFPIIWVLERLAGFVMGTLSNAEVADRKSLMEGELRTLIDTGLEEGVLEKSQRDLIHRVFDLEDTEVGEIMTPRVDMFCLPLSMKIQSIRTKIIRHGFSRVPVYGADPDDIVGVLYAKDLLTALPSNGQDRKIEELIKKPYFIPIEMSAASLLKDFQMKKIHLAIVVDEYGGIAGLVTMEDILESLFGDIYDERDTRERLYHVLNDHTMIIMAMMPIDSFNNLADMSLSSEDYDTLGGYVLHLFGKLPARGDEISDDQYQYKIEKMAQARIIRIRVTKLEKSDDGL
jgi:CBS domain containing-hemolysin-like protein